MMEFPQKLRNEPLDENAFYIHVSKFDIEVKVSDVTLRTPLTSASGRLNPLP